MFELLFKFEPELFSRGGLELGWSWTAYAATALAIGVAVYLLLGYARLTATALLRQRATLCGIRSALLALLLLVSLGPVLVVEIEEGIRGRVAVLIDDSLSMRIPDMDGRTRADFVEEFFAPGSGSLSKALAQRFDTQHFRFSGTVGPLAADEALSFSGSRTDIAAALEWLAREQQSSALAALVLVTDGGLDSRAPLGGALHALRAADIVVHAVAVGSERFATELDVVELSLPQTVLQGDSVDANVTLRHRGLGGRRVTLLIEDEDAIVAERLVTMPTDRDRSTVSVRLALTESGLRRVAARIAVEPGELITDNNVAQRTVAVRDTPVRVLHFEGEPRFEVKFLRRAVAADDNIRLVSLIRTAENKFYRLGVDSAEQLSGGFPNTDEALFGFDALVLGSVEAKLLSLAHQERIRDFVARRGGGLLLLGGSHSFAEGGYSGTVLAGLMPVVLAEANGDYRAEVKVRPTVAGRNDPLLLPWQPNPGGLWDRLPTLTVVNPLRRTKPGAIALLEGHDGSSDPLVIFAHHRYGRGTVAVLAVRNTWRWQMHADIAIDDETHETLWRQLLRQLGLPAMAQVTLRVEPSRAALGQSVEVRAEALDAAYRPLQDADLQLQVATPLGDMDTIRLEQAVQGVGYHAQFVAHETGRYELHVSRPGSGELGAVDAFVEVTSAGGEFHDAELDLALLTRIAEGTGGRVFRAADVQAIPESIDPARGARTVVQRLELWDAPVLLLALLGLGCAEWLYRRRCRLA